MNLTWHFIILEMYCSAKYIHARCFLLHVSLQIYFVFNFLAREYPLNDDGLGGPHPGLELVSPTNKTLHYWRFWK